VIHSFSFVVHSASHIAFCILFVHFDTIYLYIYLLIFIPFIHCCCVQWRWSLIIDFDDWYSIWFHRWYILTFWPHSLHSFSFDIPVHWHSHSFIVVDTFWCYLDIYSLLCVLHFLFQWYIQWPTVAFITCSFDDDRRWYHCWWWPIDIVLLLLIDHSIKWYSFIWPMTSLMIQYSHCWFILRYFVRFQYSLSLFIDILTSIFSIPPSLLHYSIYSLIFIIDIRYCWLVFIYFILSHSIFITIPLLFIRYSLVMGKCHLMICCYLWHCWHFIVDWYSEEVLYIHYSFVIDTFHSIDCCWWWWYSFIDDHDWWLWPVCLMMPVISIDDYSIDCYWLLTDHWYCSDIRYGIHSFIYLIRYDRPHSILRHWLLFIIRYTFHSMTIVDYLTVHSFTVHFILFIHWHYIVDHSVRYIFIRYSSIQYIHCYSLLFIIHCCYSFLMTDSLFICYLFIVIYSFILFIHCYSIPHLFLMIFIRYLFDTIHLIHWCCWFSFDDCSYLFWLLIFILFVHSWTIYSHCSAMHSFSFSFAIHFIRWYLIHLHSSFDTFTCSFLRSFTIIHSTLLEVHMHSFLVGYICSLRLMPVHSPHSFVPDPYIYPIHSLLLLFILIPIVTMHLPIQFSFDTSFHSFIPVVHSFVDTCCWADTIHSFDGNHSMGDIYTYIYTIHYLTIVDYSIHSFEEAHSIFHSGGLPTSFSIAMVFGDIHWYRESIYHSFPIQYSHCWFIPSLIDIIRCSFISSVDWWHCYSDTSWYIVVSIIWLFVVSDLFLVIIPFIHSHSSSLLLLLTYSLLFILSSTMTSPMPFICCYRYILICWHSRYMIFRCYHSIQYSHSTILTSTIPSVSFIVDPSMIPFDLDIHFDWSLIHCPVFLLPHYLDGSTVLFIIYSFSDYSLFIVFITYSVTIHWSWRLTIIDTLHCCLSWPRYILHYSLHSIHSLLFIPYSFSFVLDHLFIHSMWYWWYPFILMLTVDDAMTVVDVIPSLMEIYSDIIILIYDTLLLLLHYKLFIIYHLLIQVITILPFLLFCCYSRIIHWYIVTFIRYIDPPHCWYIHSFIDYDIHLIRFGILLVRIERKWPRERNSQSTVFYSGIVIQWYSWPIIVIYYSDWRVIYPVVIQHLIFWYDDVIVLPTSIHWRKSRPSVDRWSHSFIYHWWRGEYIRWHSIFLFYYSRYDTLLFNLLFDRYSFILHSYICWWPFILTSMKCCVEILIFDIHSDIQYCYSDWPEVIIHLLTRFLYTFSFHSFHLYSLLLLITYSRYYSMLMPLHSFPTLCYLLLILIYSIRYSLEISLFIHFIPTFYIVVDTWYIRSIFWCHSSLLLIINYCLTLLTLLTSIHLRWPTMLLRWLIHSFYSLHSRLGILMIFIRRVPHKSFYLILGISVFILLFRYCCISIIPLMTVLFLHWPILTLLIHCYSFIPDLLMMIHCCPLKILILTSDHYLLSFDAFIYSIPFVTFCCYILFYLFVIYSLFIIPFYWLLLTLLFICWPLPLLLPFDIHYDGGIIIIRPDCSATDHFYIRYTDIIP